MRQDTDTHSDAVDASLEEMIQKMASQTASDILSSFGETLRLNGIETRSFDCQSLCRLKY